MIRLLALAFLCFLVTACGSTKSQRLIYHSGSPWAEATINGRPGVYLIDTGASMSVLDSALAQQAGVEVVGAQQVIATTGEIQLLTGLVRQIELAGRTHENRIASLQDLSLFTAPGGRRQSGLIGSDFLLDYTVSFDMRRARFELHRQPAPTRPGLIPHSMRMTNGIPTVPVFFGDARTARWAKLDTGSGYSDENYLYVDVSAEIARDLLGHRMDLPPAETVRVISLAGTEELRIFEYGPFRIFGRTFETVRLVVHDHGNGAFANENAILVTGGFLSHFNHVEIDYPRRTIWVSPR